MFCRKLKYGVALRNRIRNNCEFLNLRPYKREKDGFPNGVCWGTVALLTWMARPVYLNGENKPYTAGVQWEYVLCRTCSGRTLVVDWWVPQHSGTHGEVSGVMLEGGGTPGSGT